ncbi:hypothetical protein BTZ20_0831 [Rhodococcus sp. MTM3W5.2]|nr:hypothetical protein BTZ20_0831 [Rhodococcus sp. MTM3W5.2]
MVSGAAGAAYEVPAPTPSAAIAISDVAANFFSLIYKSPLETKIDTWVTTQSRWTLICDSSENKAQQLPADPFVPLTSPQVIRRS